MSKDIRSFFTVVGKKPGTSPSPTAASKPSTSSKRKSKAIQLSSDEDEVVAATPPAKKEESHKSHRNQAKKRRVIESDDDDDVPAASHEKKANGKPNLGKLKAKEEPKLTPISASDYLAQAMVKSEKEVKAKQPEKVEKKKETPVVELESDDDLEASILEALDKSLSQPFKKSKTTGKSPAKPSSTEKEKRKPTPEKQPTPKAEKSQNGHHDAKESKSAKKTPKPKKPVESADSFEDSVQADEDRQEKKRISMILYQKFKNRGGPPNPGSKEIPKGAPNCLAGLQFLVTGILDSMERDEAADLIKEYGGKVVNSVSKKLNFMVVGEDAGPAKLGKADELKIKQISEDDLLNLIRTKSGQPEKGGVKKTPVKEVKEVKVEKKTPTPTKKRKSDNTPPEPPKKEKAEVKEEPVVSTSHTITDHEKNIASEDNKAWVDKYKPTSVKQIIGQQGAASNCQKLLNWLSKWHTNHDGKKKLAKPNPWAKNDDGAFYKAALLSGPPGVGKTTTAVLVCKELGYDAVEFNASDTRSKKLLKQEVADLLSNKSLYGYFSGDEKKVSKKHVLLMDEVDGMAGNEDRGGIAELIGLIKESSVPVICMCNDRNHQKMRSLVNYCYDLRFSKPRVEQIKGAMMSICFKEGLKLESGALEEIISGTCNDVRQTLTHLSMYAADKGVKVATAKAKDEAHTAKKDVKLGPWEVIRKVFSAEEHKKMTMYDKSDLFFYDYSMAPLFVQQNYLSVKPAAPKNEVINLVAKTADSLSLGDLVDRRIRSQMAWSLLPVQAMFSSVLPGEYMAGSFTSQIDFPGWLGKNSRQTKRKRLAQELHDHTRLRTSGSRLSIRLDYAPFLLAAIVNPLKQKAMDGVADSLAVIKEYRLLREDIDSLIELCSWPKKKSPWDEVESKVKAALTRAYNKEVQPYTYSVVAVGAKKKRAAEAVDEEAVEGYGMEGEEGAAYQSDDENDEEEDKIEANAFLKVKKKPAAAAKAETSKASGSKGKAGGAAKGSKAKK